MKFINKLFILILLLALSLSLVDAKPKKKGMISRAKDAAAYGFGWQLGKEGAKAVIEKSKEVEKSPKTKENIRKVKEKVTKTINELKNEKKK